MRCYSKWVRGDFSSATKWGEIGQNLKNSSGVDTKYDVSHNLALAQRDAGQPEAALLLFLNDRKLSEVVDPDELDEDRGGSHYGNIGRCLHLMGQIDAALVCYQKSALLIEKATQEHVLNQGFIRAWVGELLVAREQFNLAYIFFRAAYLRWEHVSPPRAAQLKQFSLQIQRRVTDVAQIPDSRVERIFVDWILGHNVDAKLR